MARKLDLLKSSILDEGSKWSLAGPVDWNRDGVQDLVWQTYRNPRYWKNSDLPFRVEVWLMRNTASSPASQVAQILTVPEPFIRTTDGERPLWGPRDFDGDGSVDLAKSLWPSSQSNGIRGTLACSMMTKPGAMSTFEVPAPSEFPWNQQRVGTGDLDFDGIPEIVLYDPSARSLVGMEVTSTCPLPPKDNSWGVQVSPGLATPVEAARLSVSMPFPYWGTSMGWTVGAR